MTDPGDDRPDEPDYVIQETCWAYRCDDPEAEACPGRCDCPHHEMDDPAMVSHFARGLRNEPNEQCRWCPRWVRATRRMLASQHNHPVLRQRCIGSGRPVRSWAQHDDGYGRVAGRET